MGDWCSDSTMDSKPLGAGLIPASPAKKNLGYLQQFYAFDF